VTCAGCVLGGVEGHDDEASDEWAKARSRALATTRQKTSLRVGGHNQRVTSVRVKTLGVVGGERECWGVQGRCPAAKQQRKEEERKLYCVVIIVCSFRSKAMGAAFPHAHAKHNKHQRVSSLPPSPTHSCCNHFLLQSLTPTPPLSSYNQTGSFAQQHAPVALRTPGSAPDKHTLTPPRGLHLAQDHDHEHRVVVVIRPCVQQQQQQQQQQQKTRSL